MSIVPNLLVTGILASLVSLIFLVWAIKFVQRKHGGQVMMLLSIIMLLVGGGIWDWKNTVKDSASGQRETATGLYGASAGRGRASALGGRGWPPRSPG